MGASERGRQARFHSVLPTQAGIQILAAPARGTGFPPARERRSDSRRYNPLMPRLIAIATLLVCLLLAGGCNNVRRSILITSEPSGALVWLNGREIGRTPVEVDFLYYGNYDVQLVAEGHDPLLTSGKAEPPLWDHVPLDLVSELTPPRKHARIVWHYVLPSRDDDPQALLERARGLRERIATE
jgi:hypothetical protein